MKRELYELEAYLATSIGDMVARACSAAATSSQMLRMHDLKQLRRQLETAMAKLAKAESAADEPGELEQAAE